jgi:hypothetical protein
MHFVAALDRYPAMRGVLCLFEGDATGTGLPRRDGRSCAPAHDVLGLTGLAIGLGIPLAAGAASACPDRPVICLEAGGSAMYTLSALWMHARERLRAERPGTRRPVRGGDRAAGPASH